MTDTELAEIEAGWKNRGPWICVEDGEIDVVDEWDKDGDWLSSHSIAHTVIEREEDEDPEDKLAPLIASAPTTIKRLLAELRRLREALIPFARMHTDDIDGKPLSDRIPCDAVYTLIYCESEERPTVGDVHRARTALGDGWRAKE